MNDPKMRTLYAGNLHPLVTESLLCELFSSIGFVRLLKIVRDLPVRPYAFLQFKSHSIAAAAMDATNGRLFLGKVLKVNWAFTPTGQPRPNTSGDYRVYVGNLGPEICTKTLERAFAPYGHITSCRIVQDIRSKRPKVYAFVSFDREIDALNAIRSMDGQLLGSQTVCTNWSARNPIHLAVLVGGRRANTLDDVYRQSGPTNCTVYCGGFGEGTTKKLIQQVFARFGTIVHINLIVRYNFAFIKFSTKEAATIAIEALHQTVINGRLVNCSWRRKEPALSLNSFSSVNLTNMSSTAFAIQNSMYSTNYDQGMKSGYPNASYQRWPTCYAQQSIH